MVPNVFAPPPQLLQLPHPEIDLSTILIVEEALRTAWELLRNKPPNGFILAKAHEDIVTEKFLSCLSNQVLNNKMVDGFSKQLFRISREPKHPNYSGKHPDKMPDLVVQIIDRPRVTLLSEDGLFIECKPIDAKHTVGVDYCGEGLIRFVEGGYAWTMHQAMMIGYVRGKYTIIPKLHKALKKREAMNSGKRIKTAQYPCADPISQNSSWYEAVHISSHEREFLYKETGQPAPPITIRHLWLRRD